MTARLSRLMPAIFAAISTLLAKGSFAAELVAPVPPSTFATFMQMLLALATVMAAIAAMAWLVRRLSPGQVGTSGDMRVVAAVAVGPKERVVLVDVGDTRLVLGVAPGQINRLMEMPRPELVPSEQVAPSPFVIKLKALLAGRGEA